MSSGLGGGVPTLSNQMGSAQKWSISEAASSKMSASTWVLSIEGGKGNWV